MFSRATSHCCANWPLLAVAGFALVLAACAQARLPTPRAVEKARTYNASFDQVWDAAIVTVAELNLPIDELEKDSGIISFDEARYQPNDADEGSLGYLETIMQRRGSANIIVRSVAPSQTKAQINLRLAMFIQSGNGSLYFPFRFFWRDTVSNGNIERRLLAGIESRIGAGVAVPSPSPYAATGSTGVTPSPARTSNRWIGDGARDACGASWAMDLSLSPGLVTGTLWRDEVPYDVRGELDRAGQMKGGRAAKERSYAHVPAPRFLTLDLTFRGDTADGFYALNAAGSLSCATRVVLKPF